MRTSLALFLVLLAVLAFTNPGMDEFKDFAEAQSEQLLLRETGDTGLGRFLSRLGGSLAGSLVDRVTERANYGVASVYTIDLDPEVAEGDEWRFLGIAGQFLELERPDELQADEGR